MSTFHIIGVSVDSLEDISLAALRILGGVDFILSEDEGWAEKLLSHYKIKTRLAVGDKNADERQIEELASWLAAGKNIALVSETGLPGISDFGGKLALTVREKFSGQIGAVSVEFIPGDSAATAALAISGLTSDKFIFLGRPPRGAGRPHFIRRVLESVYPVVIYESRIDFESFLKELTQAARENRQVNKKGESELKPVNPIIVAVYREPEKRRETVYRGQVKRIIEKIRENENDSTGEFMVIIGKVNPVRKVSLVGGFKPPTATRIYTSDFVKGFFSNGVN